MDGSLCRRGSALLLVVIATLVIAGLSGALLAASVFSGRKTANDLLGLQALYLAEAGSSVWVNGLRNGAAPAALPDPVELGGGTYTVPVVHEYGANGRDDDGDGEIDNAAEGNFMRVESVGEYAGNVRRIEIVLARFSDPSRWTLWSANSSEDPYALTLNGQDQVKGNIYTGGGLEVGGAAEILNEDGGTDPPAQVMLPDEDDYVYTSSATDETRVVSGTQTAPRIPRDPSGTLEVQALAESGTPGYVDVAGELAVSGLYGLAGGTTNWLGGAMQILDGNNPAHLFRKDPTINPTLTFWAGFPSSTAPRTDAFEICRTGKEDYYLEDPTMASGNNHLGAFIMDEPLSNSNRALELRMSPGGNNLVYFVDGNLWLSHDGFRTARWTKPPGEENMKVTIVVKGNINLGDNIVYEEFDKDILALIAAEDPAYPNVSHQDLTPERLSDGSYFLPNGQTIAEFIAEARGVEDWALANLRAQDAVADDLSYLHLDSLDLNQPLDRQRLSQIYNRAYGSGNTFFGTTRGAMTDTNDCFIYSENNFYTVGLTEVSLQADGSSINNDGNGNALFSKSIRIRGSVTAGNQVLLGDRVTPTGAWVPLELAFDDKIQNGIVPPRLWDLWGQGDGEWRIVSWRTLPPDGERANLP